MNTGPEDSVDLFVPGRICMFGEHSDWSGGFRRFNADIKPGCAIVSGTTQGIYAKAWKLPDKRVVIFRGHDGGMFEAHLDDLKELERTAQSPSAYAYIAGTVWEICKNFRVGGLEIVNYRMDLPLKKGLSSSAAICVLVVRALNELYDLKLTHRGEMDIAYRGEINTPSRCGRLDQCVAFGRAITKMKFDGDNLDCETVRLRSALYMVIVDLQAAKDTKEILKSLSSAYPFAKDERDKALHRLLGEINEEVCAKAIELLESCTSADDLATHFGALMTAAQERWDTSAVPLCPQELTAPVLHRLLSSEALKPFITGGKGVGSQGDGSAQLVCKNAAAQEAAMKVVESLGMVPIRLSLEATKAVRTAVLPLAGLAVGTWPATKCSQPWLFPVCADAESQMIKPAICWICEELVHAGIERIVMIVNELTESDMQRLFKQREQIDNLHKVAERHQKYDDELMMIGKRIQFVRQTRPTGIRDALLLCEDIVGDEPFILAWGDHLCSSTEDRGCIEQLLDAFDGTHCIASMFPADRSQIHNYGIFKCDDYKVLQPPGEIQRLNITSVAEKPTSSFADQHLRTPGLREGQFLASFGQYVLNPCIFNILRRHPNHHFSEAVDSLRQEKGLHGVVIHGKRWDLGNFVTYMEALQAQASSTCWRPKKRPRSCER